LITAIKAAPALAAKEQLDAPYVFDVRLSPPKAMPSVFDTLVVTFVSGPQQPLFHIPADDQPNDVANLAQWSAHFSACNRPLSCEARLIAPEDRWDDRGHRLLQDAGRNRTYELRRDANGVTVIDLVLWPMIRIAGEEEWRKFNIEGDTVHLALRGLPIDQSIDISYKFVDLEILTHQNDLGSSEITRNDVLVAQYETSSDFVYKTGIATFPSVVTPSLTYPDAVRLNHYAPGGTLRQGLSGYFQEITEAPAEADPDGVISISVVGGFMFDLAEGYGAILRTGPLLLQAPNVAFSVSEDWKDQGDTFVDKLPQATATRGKNVGIPDGKGRFQYSVQIFSNLTGANHTVPLVTFNDVCFDRS
jgi:hypothetical protein